MMEAIVLVLILLEKVSVLVATALFLLLLRPAEVWLGETGARASLRRRAFLVILLGALAVWGTFLGFEVEGTQFNIRMVGIIVAGYLGGVGVGVVVGAAAGGLYALEIGNEMSPYVFLASVLNGGLAGLWSRRWGTKMASVTVGAFVIQGIQHVAIAAVMAPVNLELTIAQSTPVQLHIAKVTANSVGILLFMGLLSLVRELEAARQEAMVSRADARAARLEALQYQLQPHFLFNLLNTLSYLIRTSPDRARELTIDLADFLRYTLDREGKDTTLRDELEQIERYVELERARFGEGLRFTVDLPDDEEVQEVLVPPLILQPLVENAIRHGSREGAVVVHVEVLRRGGELVIAVADDGPGPPKDPMPLDGSVGLTNVSERLSRFFRDQASLTLTTNPGGQGARAEVILPMNPTEDTPGLADQARKTLRTVVELDKGRHQK